MPLNLPEPCADEAACWTRAQDLLARFGDPRASAAELLCDRHDPCALAYRLIGDDLSARDLTYGELRAQSEKLAAGFAGAGVGPGDRVATLMGKSGELLVTLMAILRLGAVHVPLFTAFAPPAIALRLGASRAKVVVCDADQRAKLAPGGEMPVDPPWRIVTTGEAGEGDLYFDDLGAGGAAASPTVALGGDAPIIEIFTSGTTGTPKSVIVPLRAVASFQAYGEFALGLTDDDVFWNAADPGWAYGLYFGILVTFSLGVRSVLHEGHFTPEATLAVLERERVTNFAAAPTVYRVLRASGLAPPRGLALRRASSAGEPLTPEVNDWAREALGVQVHDHYGQTETGMLINNHHHPALQRPLRAGSMGHPMPGWTAAVLKADADAPAEPDELGRLAMDLSASPLAWFDGYSGDPERTVGKFTSDRRWYVTGDLARVDDDGYVVFASRDDDVIIMAGYRIGPTEVESVLLTHPAVAECAAVAVPDEMRGEVLEAVVVLRPGHAASDDLTAELQTRVKTGFAAHAYPRRVHYADSLPRTPSGKVQRFLIRRRLREAAIEPAP